VGVGKEQYSEHILKDSVGISNYTTFVDVEEAIDALNEGKIDVIFENQDVVNHYLIKKGLTGKIIPHKRSFSRQSAYGVSKRNPELVKYINERLDSVKKTVYMNSFIESISCGLQISTEENRESEILPQCLHCLSFWHFCKFI